jgi:hypothetical protein
MKVSELINDSYRFGNIIAEEGQDLTAVQLADGVRLLNYVINKINIDGDEIALNANESLSLTAGVDTLLLPDYIKVTKMQYNLGNVFLDVHLQSFEDFYNGARVAGVSSIPYSGYQRRTPEGVEVKLYFIPDADYELRIVGGLKKIKTLAADDEIDTETNFYFELLTWELANYLRRRNQLPRDMEIISEIREIKDKLKRIKPNRTNVVLSNVGKIGSTSALTHAMQVAAEANTLGGWRP